MSLFSEDSALKELKALSILQWLFSSYLDPPIKPIVQVAWKAEDLMVRITKSVGRAPTI